jgi:serine/threonine protein kinase
MCFISGITLIELAQIEPPYHGLTPVRAMLKIQKAEPPRLDCPSEWSNEFNDFLAKCLVIDASQRLTATELLSHPFIAEGYNEAKFAFDDLLLECYNLTQAKYY